MTATNIGSRGRVPWLTLCILAIVLTGYGAGRWFLKALIYERDGILAGEFWRLLTGHLVHIDGPHLFWNAATFLVLGAVYEMRPDGGTRRLGLIVTGGFLVVGLWLLTAEPGVDRYAGLSGMLNGLFVALVVLLWRSSGSLVFPMLLAGNFVKVVAEILIGGAIFDDVSWDTVPSIHAAGCAVGVAVCWRMLLLPAASVVKDHCGSLRPAAIVRPDTGSRSDGTAGIEVGNAFRLTFEPGQSTGADRGSYTGYRLVPRRDRITG